jgi:hypothetical protein
MPASASRSEYRMLTYCEPLSLWHIRPPLRSGCRAYKACSSASSTKSVRIELLTRQPTIRRANTSMTKATYSQPCQVDTYVKSMTHSWFGRWARNCRLIRSSGHGALASPMVVLQPCLASPREAPSCASAARLCNGRLSRLREPVTARLCRRHRPAYWPARHVESQAPGLLLEEPGHSVYGARAAALHAFDTPTGRPAIPCRAARPRTYRYAGR